MSVFIFVYFIFYFSGLRLVAWYMCTDVSEEHIALVSLTEDPNSEFGGSRFLPNVPTHYSA